MKTLLVSSIVVGLLGSAGVYAFYNSPVEKAKRVVVNKLSDSTIKSFSEVTLNREYDLTCGKVSYTNRKGETFTDEQFYVFKGKAILLNSDWISSKLCIS